MRRSVFVATVSATVGFCLASASSYAMLRYNIWKGYGDTFQLGYVIGYLDAATLSQRKDIRLNVPTGRGKNFERWVKDVNAFYADPANASRDLPDAMYEVGTRLRDQILRDWGQKQRAQPVPSASAAP